MTMKSLLLGAAAGLVTVGAAQAADLPMTKAEAVEYVKVCTEFGAGFFYIPGSDTCLKIGGEVRADYVFQEMNVRTDDGVVFKGRGQVSFDARTATEYGLLRSMIVLNVNLLSGGATTVTADKAYIQFGGLTAGYAHSFYGIYDAEYGNTTFAGYYTYADTTNLLAYTATFGGGFSATLSVEDGKHTRSTEYVDDLLNLTQPQAGVTAPDLVGSLRVDQAWGKAAIFAAVHQNRELARAATVVAPILPAYGGDDTKYGYAVGAALAINLPVAAGGHVVVEGNYANGASAYLGSKVVDIFFDPATGAEKLGKGWSIVGEIGVNVTPALTINAFGSYIDYNAPDVAGNGVAAVGEADFKNWIAGVNAWYTITKGLSVGAEVYYSDNDFSAAANAAGVADTTAWVGGVRIKRTF
jgi:hypothetical protein